jgi:tetratricopeptide (TPR) repeat protein
MRQAETALKDGRLDEAFELARSSDVRAHRRGQELIGRLVRALAERGRQHLEAGRLTQAAADGEKALQLGGQVPEVAELRASLEDAAKTRQEQDRRKANAIGAAREHLHNGQLSMGGRVLAAIDNTYRADMLRGELDACRGEVELCLVRAEDALRREDWRTAVEALLRVEQLHPANTRRGELLSQLTSRMTDRVRTSLQQGRLDQARVFMQLAAPCSSKSVELTELQNALDLIGRTAAALQTGECRRAIEMLHQLRAIVPTSAWLDQAIADAEQAAEAMERLRGGPLGMVMATGTHQAPSREREHENTVVLKPAEFRGPAREIHSLDATPGTLPTRLMMHVDGVGSFLLIRDRSLSIGCAGGSRQPAVPLLMDSSVGPATIERADEDYFLTCGRPVLINNQPLQRKLLVNGDRIAMSPKCHVRFSMPNAASTSALLSIAGARMPGTDATRVVLLDRSMVIGPGNSAHVRADELPAPVVLHVRDGRLFCNTEQQIAVDGRPMDRQAGLPLNAQIRIGTLSMVIQAA